MTTSSELAPIPAELTNRPVQLNVVRARGAARVIEVSPTAIYVQSAGHLDLEIARQICVATLEAAAAAPLASLVDWSAMRSYDVAARQAITKMVLSHFRWFTGVTVLTGSPMVSLGVSTAGLAAALVGVPVHGTTDRTVFVAELRRHLA